MSSRISFKQINTNRLFIISVVFCILTIVIITYLFVVQIKNHKILTAEAQSMQETQRNIQPKRGAIYFQDKEGNKISVAVNKTYKILFAVPVEIQKIGTIDSTAKTLSDILHIDYDTLITKFSKKDDKYEIVFPKLEDKDLISQIEKLKLPGIYFSDDSFRYYPLGNLGCHVIGFVGETKEGNGKKVGQYGLEKKYDSILEGQAGNFKGIKDAFGRLIRSLTSEEEPANDGSNIVATIDKNVQYKADEEVTRLATTRIGTSASIIVMEPKTGKIIAMSNWPNYNLNEYSKVDSYKVYKNPAVEDAVEIGSVMKVVTMSAALDTGAVEPNTTYTDKGNITIDKKTIKNYKEEIHGVCDMTTVLQYSINTGAVFAQQQTGNKLFLEYLKRFKLNERTGIDLPNEGLDNISNLELDARNARDIYYATASFGHGITISSINMARAYATIANKGALVNPYVIEKIEHPDGTIEDLSKQYTSGDTILKPETIKKITDMMVKVVEGGYGKNAKIQGYDIAGKTGTADIASGGKYSSESIQSFAGFFPAYNPRFVILVKLDKPQIGAAASATVTYSFHNMAQFLINYYNIPPDHE